MSVHKTKLGTELPILNLKGKDYLEVKFRLVWFREEHPDWSIETEIKHMNENMAFAKATIKDPTGRIMATSHKLETIQGFADFIEKAETGAIGRALALIGFGTQFCADELDEGARIVDAPVNKNNRSFNEPKKTFTPKVLAVSGKPTENYQVETVTVAALVSFEEKQLAKDAGFQFDKASKRWIKQIPADQVNANPWSFDIAIVNE